MALRVQDEDDLGRIAGNLAALAYDVTRSGTEVSTVDPVTGVRSVARTAPPLEQEPRPRARS